MADKMNSMIFCIHFVWLLLCFGFLCLAGLLFVYFGFHFCILWVFCVSWFLFCFLFLFAVKKERKNIKLGGKGDGKDLAGRGKYGWNIFVNFFKNNVCQLHMLHVTVGIVYVTFTFYLQGYTWRRYCSQTSQHFFFVCQNRVSLYLEVVLELTL